jgi:hypothetical protein
LLYCSGAAGPRRVLLPDELTTALEIWIKFWNANARPFKWTRTADQITDRICRYCSRISGPEH